MTAPELLQCPKCQSRDIHRSRARTRWDEWRKAVTGKRPFRCRGCGWRGWAIDPGPAFDDREIELATRALAPEPPNLKATGLGRDEKVASVNLTELDSFESTGEKPR